MAPLKTHWLIFVVIIADDNDMDGSLELCNWGLVHFNALTGWVDGTVNIDGVAFGNQARSLGAGSEQDGISSHKNCSIWVDLLHLDWSRVSWKASIITVVKRRGGIDLEGSLSSSIGNYEGRCSVSSIFGSISNIQSSNCLIEIPLSSTKSIGCILVGCSSIL